MIFLSPKTVKFPDNLLLPVVWAIPGSEVLLTSFFYNIF
jgi:hypothetical protein